MPILSISGVMRMVMVASLTRMLDKDDKDHTWDRLDICLTREVFENTYQGQPSLLVVMEWWESSSSQSVSS